MGTGFQQGWDAVSDWKESQRQKRRDKSDRKLSKAQASVMKEDARRKRKEQDTREEQDAYKAKKLSKAQEKKLQSVREDYGEGAATYKTPEEAAAAASALEEKYLSEIGTGRLAGTFIKGELQTVRGKAADIRKQKIANRQAESKATVEEAVNAEMLKEGRPTRLAEAGVREKEVDVDSTIASTRKTNAESEGLENNNYYFEQDRLANLRLSRTNAATARKQSEIDYNVSKKALEEIQLRINQFGATAKDNVEYGKALDRVFNDGLGLMAHTPKVKDGNVLSHFAKLKEIAASLPTGAQAGGGSRGRAADLKRAQFHATLKDHIDTFKTSEKYKSALKHQANVDIAEIGMSGNSQVRETYKNADELTKGEMRIPYIVHRRLVDAGIPAGAMNDTDFNEEVMRVVPHPDPNQRYFRDPDGKFMYDEKSGRLLVRTVMLESDVMRNLDNFIANWKEKNTPKPIFRQNIREDPEGKALVDWGGDPDAPSKPTVTSEESITGAAAMFENQHPDFETYESLTTGGEIDRVLHSLNNPQEDNLATIIRGMDEERRKALMSLTPMSAEWAKGVIEDGRVPVDPPNPSDKVDLRSPDQMSPTTGRPPIKGRNPASERDAQYEREHPADAKKRMADAKKMREQEELYDRRQSVLLQWQKAQYDYSMMKVGKGGVTKRSMEKQSKLIESLRKKHDSIK